MPEPMKTTSRGFEPRIIEGSRPTRPQEAIELDDGEVKSLPMMGRIAAGVPIAAIEDYSRNIAVPSEMVSDKYKHYALEVKGDSMIGVGINDGDVVVIRETNTAQTGDIVVALVDDQEATLKRFRLKGSTIVLEAANPAYESRVFRDHRVKVQGKLVGLIRTY